MPLNAAQYQALVVVKVGDTGIVAANIATLWTMHDDKLPLELQYQYVLIEAIELLLGGAWNAVTWSGDGRSVSDSDQFKNLISLASRADLRIKELISNRTAVGVVVGVLSTRAPIASPTGLPDANSTDYTGDPNKPWTTRGGDGITGGW